VTGSWEVPGFRELTRHYRVDVFLYIELFDFQIQPSTAEFEFGGRSIWPCTFPVLSARAASMSPFH